MTEHSANEVGEAVGRVFSDPAYVDEARSLELGRGLVEFLIKLRELYQKLIDLLASALEGEWGWVFYLLGALLALFVGYLLYQLVRAFLQAPGASEGEEEGGPEGVKIATSRELWDRAHALAAEGRWAEALRNLILTLAAHLRADKTLRYSPAWTNHELMTGMHLAGDDGLALGRLVDTVDRAWYGEGDATGEEFRDGCTLVAKVAGLERRDG